MKKIVLGFLLTVTSVFSVNSQLVVDNTTQTPEQLVQNVLVGTGVTVSNVSWNGSLAAALAIQEQAGEFSGTSSIGLGNGVILGSGDVTMAIGPNVGTGSTLGGSGMSGTDPDLAAIATAGLNDEAVLEFDFVPQGDSIKFRYVFSSEEYPEYVCSTFNDVFGFFITGPNPAGGSYVAQNIALIPGSTLPVAINTVNPGVTGAFGTVGGCTSLAYSAFYTDNTGGTTIEYDGYTVVMEARAAVQCGQTYHIKLAVADAGDGAFDSGVFLEGGSFTSNAIDVTIATPTSTGFVNGQIYEGCAIGTNATFYLVRPDAGGADTVSFSYTGSATLGLDYTSTTPDTIAIFPAGQDTAFFGVNIINDGITEGLDSLIVTVYNINLCGDTITSSAVLYINDPLVIICDIPDDTINCIPTVVNLNGNATGSPLTMTYSWTGPSGFSASTINTSYSASGGEQFIFTATDQCLFSGSDTVNIVYIPVPVFADAGLDQTLACPGDVVNLSGTAIDGIAPYTYTWTAGATTILSTASGTYTPGATQNIVLTIVDNCGATDSDTMMVTVPVSNPYNLSYPASDSVLCAGDQTTVTVLVNSGGIAPYSYSWNNGDTDSSSLYTVNTSPTLATLTITDNCGRDTSVTIPLTIQTFAPLVITASDGQYCFSNDNTISIPVQTTGGAGNNVFMWSGPTGTTTTSDATGTGIVTNAVDGIYYVLVTDVCGNLDADSAEIVAIPCEITIPNVVTPNGDGSNDAIVIVNLEYHPNSYFGLYNRWGQVMYENSNYQNDYKPTELSDGVYFYIVKLTDGTTPSDFHGQMHVIKKK